MTPAVLARLRKWGPLVAVVVVATLFRLPPLLNASAISSDGAIVGLQARHMLQGEWSKVLWGTSYQASFDSLLAAFLFSLLGARPIALIAVPFLGALVMVAFAFEVLRRRISPGAAFVAVLPLCFATMAINQPLQHIMRQTMITAMMVGIWALDGAHEHRRALALYALGGTALGFGWYIDSFAAVMAPACATFAICCSFDGSPRLRQVMSRLASCVGGTLVGAAPGYWLYQAEAPRLTISRVIAELPSHLRPSFNLLWDACLPFTLGYKVFIPGRQLYPVLWDPPRALGWIQVLGALLFGAGLLFSVVAVALRSVPWQVRRLGVLGLIASVCTAGAFVSTGFAADVWAARYLAPIVWLAPFSFAPAARVLGGRRFSFAMAPYLLSIAVGGWLSYGNFVRGPLPFLDARGQGTDEARVADVLRAKGVHYGTAQYWLAYRLTFLFGEDPIIVPLSPNEDRYAPYRTAFDNAKTVAFIFHPSEPRATPEPYIAMLNSSHISYERLDVSGFTLLVVQR